MSALSKLLKKANKWETKMRIPEDSARKRWRKDFAPDITDTKETATSDAIVNRNNDWSDIGRKKNQMTNQRKQGMNAKQMYATETKFTKPADPSRLPKSLEASTMNKSSLEKLCDLAKANVVGRMDGTSVNMSSPASVSTAKVSTRQRAQKIRTASPTIKSTSKKATKSASCAKPYVKSTKKKSAGGTSPEFDLDAFNREFPPELESAGNTSLDNVDRTLSAKRMAAGKKAPSMDAQAARMKMKSSAKKSLVDYRNDLVKSLDPTILPRAGTMDRKNFEDAFNSWKPTPKPADWKPLDKQTVGSLNQWAKIGHKGAIHQLMNDGHWYREHNGLNKQGRTSWGKPDVPPTPEVG
jgi:hypothetical protein